MSALAPNPEEIRATWRWLAHGAHGVSEVRVIAPGGRGIVGIGFFDDEEAFVRECVRTNAAGNVYVGIQPRPRRLFESAPNVVRPLKTGAGRKDIEVITATVIDLDPVRPKDTASTDAELALAMAAAETASAWCEAEGLVRPRLMMSGNGAQLWFALPPTALEGERRERLQAGLKAFETKVRERAQTAGVHVDSIHDVARIIKVIGTVSHKGDGKGDRPHRVSAGLSGFGRIEDAGLLARLDVEPDPSLPVAAPRTSLPILGNAPASRTTKAKRTHEGGYDWEHPVEMCGPVQRLWDQGAEDRSVAIFDMVRWFAHKGLGLDEITELVLEWDRRCEKMGKLRGRDGVRYIAKAYEKVMATRRADGTIAPPCHSLQKLGFCKVNVDPSVRCELYDVVFDIEKAIEAVPAETPAAELEVRLRPILAAIAQRDPSVWSKYLGLAEKRFGVKQKDLRKALATLASSVTSARADDEPEDLDGAIREDASCYYCLTPRGESRILSSFTIEPTMRVETEEGELILGYANTDKGGRVPNLRFPLTAFHSKRDLIRHLPSADLQWTGSDNNVQGLLRVLATKKVPRRAGTTMLGEYKRGEHHLWLGPDGAIDKDGFVDKPPVVYVPSGATLDKKVSYEPCSDEEFDKVARVVFESLPLANTAKAILPMIGWFFATPMKPRFMATVGSFPLLFVWGTQGSGKSSIIMDVLWPLFGIAADEPFSVTETEFATLKTLTATTSIPVFMDEYKPGDMQRQRLGALHRFLRRLFRGEVEQRGRPDLKLNAYHLQAPVCIAGETRPSEGAIVERIITANPLKTTLTARGSCKANYERLKTVKLRLFAPRYIQFCLGRDFGADLATARRITEKLLSERNPLPLRVVENLTAMVLGVHLFEEFAAECGCDLPEDLGMEEAVAAVLDDVVETDHGVKNAFDHFLEMLGVMAVQRILRPGIHYTLVNGNLALHLESAYDAFRAHAKRIDYERELLDLKAMRRMITESKLQDGCVVDESKKVSFGGEARRRAVIIDFAKTNGALSVDDFPTEDNGGSFKERYGGGWQDA